MKLRLFIFQAAILFFSSCSIYERNFDCFPAEGVPCTSVTDLEAMIIETQEGPDIFPPKELKCACPICKQEYIRGLKSTPSKKAIWICGPSSECCLTSGYYIYSDSE